MLEITGETKDMLVKAQSLHQQGNQAEAEALYLKLIAQIPDHPMVQFKTGLFYYTVRQYANAVYYLNKVQQLLPDEPSINYYLGSSYEGLRNSSKAMIHLNKFVESAPSNAAAYHELLRATLNLERLKRENQSFPEAIFKHSPPNLQRLQIEVTTWCNLQCAGCPRTIDMNQNRWENVHMPLAAFQTIVDTMPPSHALCLQGVGESTLHPQFPGMVDYAKKSGKYNALTLNTNLLARPIEYYRTLRELGLNHISVSVDSFDQEIATDCRKGTLVGKLEERLAELVRLYEPEILTVTIVASKRNLHDIPNTLRILNAMGRFHVEIQELIVFDGSNNGLHAEDIQILRNYASAPNPNLYVQFDAGNKRATVRCPRPFTAPYITAQGYLTPCCTVEDPAVLGHTKIDGRPFEQIWQAPQIQTWLRDYVQHAHRLCEGCCFYSG